MENQPSQVVEPIVSANAVAEATAQQPHTDKGASGLTNSSGEVEGKTAEVTENTNGANDSDAKEHDPHKGFVKKIDKLRGIITHKNEKLEQAYAENNQLKAQLDESIKSLQNKSYDGLSDDVKVEEKVLDRMEIKRLEGLQQQAQRNIETASQHDWDSRVDSFRKLGYDDYDAVVAKLDMDAHPMLIDTIKRSDYAPHIAYFLGNNPTIAKQLAKEPNPMIAMKLLNNIEDHIATEFAKTVTNNSAAPVDVQSEPQTNKKPSLKPTSAPRVGGGSVKPQGKPWTDKTSLINRFKPNSPRK